MRKKPTTQGAVPRSARRDPDKQKETPQQRSARVCARARELAAIASRGESPEEIIGRGQALIEIKQLKPWRHDGTRTFRAWARRNLPYRVARANQHIRIARGVPLHLVAGRQLCFEALLVLAEAPVESYPQIIQAAEAGASARALRRLAQGEVAGDPADPAARAEKVVRLQARTAVELRLLGQQVAQGATLPVTQLQAIEEGAAVQEALIQELRGPVADPPGSSTPPDGDPGTGPAPEQGPHEAGAPATPPLPEPPAPQPQPGDGDTGERPGMDPRGSSEAPADQGDRPGRDARARRPSPTPEKTPEPDPADVQKIAGDVFQLLPSNAADSANRQKVKCVPAEDAVRTPDPTPERKKGNTVPDKPAPAPGGIHAPVVAAAARLSAPHREALADDLTLVLRGDPVRGVRPLLLVSARRLVEAGAPRALCAEWTELLCQRDREARGLFALWFYCQAGLPHLLRNTELVREHQWHALPAGIRLALSGLFIHWRAADLRIAPS